MKRKLLHYSLLTLFMLVVGSGNVWKADTMDSRETDIPIWLLDV